jgi:hypothetical protein
MALSLTTLALSVTRKKGRATIPTTTYARLLRVKQCSGQEMKRQKKKKKKKKKKNILHHLLMFM